MIKTLHLALKRLERIAVILSWLTSLLITAIVVIDVLLRFFLNRPLPAAWEMSEVLMPYIVFFALAETLSAGAHVQVTLFLSRMSPDLRRFCEIISGCICLAVCCVFTYSSYLRFAASFAIKEEILAAVSLPWWFGKMAMPIGFGLLGARYLLIVASRVAKIET
jgi:TRAP-type C4-dicarboxylate transport system permease small subunit